MKNLLLTSLAVALLCPATVLAFGHGTSFDEAYTFCSCIVIGKVEFIEKVPPKTASHIHYAKYRVIVSQWQRGPGEVHDLIVYADGYGTDSRLPAAFSMAGDGVNLLFIANEQDRKKNPSA